MITADWVAVGLVALFLLTGCLAGFGKGLKFFATGLFGFIISVIVCYFFGGFVYKFGFIQGLLVKLTEAMSDKNGFCDFLIKIRIDVIVYYVALFIVVSLVRLFAVLTLKSIAEAPNTAMKCINKTLGMVLFAAALVMLTLIVFHFISLIGGTTADSFAATLEGSAFKLDVLFQKDLLTNIIHTTSPA